ncbi:RIO1 family regulatory kinase/ATPase [Luteimonas mephitis]|uniref:RIO1 family regulatory kinase/ATPase domain-containing protein n=1 Tax=Luteimonas mephitis TaxID=83615 RepID=UPI0003FE9190|nr:RIO1 family regulatory kinase/ATPase [Luteimonas mephitis]
MTTCSLCTASEPGAGARILKRGTRFLEPDVYVARLGAQQAVFKDYRRYRRTPLSPLARLLVRREARILERLSGWGYAPALLGTIGGLVLGMEFIDGKVLGRDVAMVSDEVFRRLKGAVAALHAAGIAHNDLHGSNILVSGGMPRVVDFASALPMPAWLARSTFGRQLRRSDLANVVKLQSRLTGTPPSPAEAEVLAEPRWVRAIRGAWKRLYRRSPAST